MNQLFDIWVAAVFTIFAFGTGAGFLVKDTTKRLLMRISLICSFTGGVVVTVGVIYFCLASPLPLTLFPVSLDKINIVHLKPTDPLDFQLKLDLLAGFFILLTGLFTAAISVYSAIWLRTEADRNWIAGAFNFFVLCTVFTVLADQVFFYLFFLEGITLAFSYLVLYRHNKNLDDEGDPHQVEIGRLAFRSYLIFNHIGIMLLTVGLLILVYGYQSFSFSYFQGAAMNASGSGNNLTPISAGLAFGLTFLGLAFKAGVFPAYVWVPIAHPQSPTNIHAMLSGIVLKVTGIYGMLRIFFQFFNPAQVQDWWGPFVLIIAGLTAVAGVFYALFAEDLKTALASHSVENLGIILFGIGLALCFIQKQPVLAVFSLMASLYHLLNHSIFKALLFLSTGAIENRTGQVKLSNLGGILKLYPWTGIAFLIGSVSIAGLPPFNGFISEWLTLQALFSTRTLFGDHFSIIEGLVILFSGLCLIVAIALTALAFAKIAGEVLLGAPRRPDLQPGFQKGEVSWHMRVIMLILSVSCVILGILPGQVSGRLYQLINAMGFNLGSTGLIPTNSWEIAVPEIATVSNQPVPAVQSVLLWAILLLIVVAVIIAGSRFFSRRGPVWNGGETWEPTKMQFNSSAFTSLIWSSLNFIRRDELSKYSEHQAFPFLIPLPGNRALVEVVRREVNRLITASIKLSQRFGDIFQNGDIRRYILYIFSALLLMLLIYVLMSHQVTR